MADIDTAFKTIKAKRPELDALDAYYTGDHPMKFSTEKLEEAFGSQANAKFIINWCAVVVDTTSDRLGLNGFDIQKDSAANKKIDALFSKLHLDTEADKAHTAALSMTQAYLIVWKTAEGEIDAYFNDPRLCAVFYDDARPKIKTFAAKWFRLPDMRHQITLYYSGRIEHWETESKKDTIAKPSDFTLRGTPEPNPYNVIPVFEFTSPGEFVKILTIQDAINMTFTNMMVAEEYGIAPQKWAISQADPGNLRNGAHTLWWFPAGDSSGQGASVGEFSAAPLVPFLDSMERLSANIAIITRTPKHYMMTTGANISGEALLAMEAPLVKKVKNRQRVLGVTWQDVAKFLLQLDGVNVEAEDIKVVWDRAESVQPLTEAQVRQVAINTGIPLITQLKREGWTEAELDELLKDQKAAKANEKTTAQALLDKLRIDDEQANPTPSADGPTAQAPTKGMLAAMQSFARLKEV